MPRWNDEPTKRLLLVPLVLLVALYTGLTWLTDGAPRADTTALRMDDLPPVQLEPRRCSRDGDERLLTELRVAAAGTPRVTSDHLTACPQAFDDLRVRYVGELVGDLLRRPDGAWVQANDDEYALVTGPLASHRDHGGGNSGIALWLPDPLPDMVTGLGGHQRRGDVVEVVGTVHRTDPADGGGLTIRVEHLRLRAASTEVPEPFHQVQAVVAGVLALLAASALVALPRLRARIPHRR